MDEVIIRKYAQLMKELDLTGLEIAEEGKSVRLERTPPSVAGAGIPVAAQSTTDTPLAEAPSAEDPSMVNVLSPMVGVFYNAPAENQHPFVSIGDTVRKGDVLCIIEAMKLMNEIISDYDGTVVEIGVGNQQVVDYGHVLFRIRKETL